MSAAADTIRTRRQAFASPGSSLDRVVRLLAVLLPALVGVVAAMMLITPLSPNAEISFLLDRNKVAIAENRLRVDNAMYRGRDVKGRPFSLVAGGAVQQSNLVPVVQMDDLVARIVLPEGPAVLSADEGAYEIDTERVDIPGVVRFTAADGYDISASNVIVDLPGRRLFGRGGVRGVIPAGRFSADSIRGDLVARTLSLQGNARLSMVPGRLQIPGAMR